MIFLLLACTAPQGTDPDSTVSIDTGTRPADTPGVYRFGPPAGTAGAYDNVWHDGRLYVSNLHTPFVTVLDGYGQWTDALDLRDAGAAYSAMPRLYLVDDALWISDAEAGRFWRFALADHAPRAPVSTEVPFTAARVTRGRLYVALEDGRVQHWRDTEWIDVWSSGLSLSAFDVQEERIGWIDTERGWLGVNGLDGSAVWRADTTAPAVDDARFVNGRLVVADRVGGRVDAWDAGAVVATATPGWDPFSLEPDGADVVVVVREGATRPASGAYEGAPARVVRLDADMREVWALDVGKTAHFLTRGTDGWWITNEDELTVSRIDPDAGVETLRSAPMGLVLDALNEDAGGRIWSASHLTDQLFVWDASVDEVRTPDTCGWPFFAVLDVTTAWVPCQDEGQVRGYALDTLEEVARLDLGGTLHPTCPQGICTSHTEFPGGALIGDALRISDPHDMALLDPEGATVATFGDPDAPRGDGGHYQVVDAGGVALVADLRGRRLVRTDTGAWAAWSGTPAFFPIVAAGGAYWVGHERFDATPTLTGALEEGVSIVAGNERWLVGIEAEDLVTFDAESLLEAARLPLESLRAPPYRHRGDEPGAMRYLVTREGMLLVANTFRATLERRALPDLGPVGSDDVRVLGAWSALDGLR
jgi:hypothetical protein